MQRLKVPNGWDLNAETPAMDMAVEYGRGDLNEDNDRANALETRAGIVIGKKRRDRGMARREQIVLECKYRNNGLEAERGCLEN